MDGLVENHTYGWISGKSLKLSLLIVSLTRALMFQF